jgi:hypothetical protein
MAARDGFHRQLYQVASSALSGQTAPSAAWSAGTGPAHDPPAASSGRHAVLAALYCGVF